MRIAHQVLGVLLSTFLSNTLSEKLKNCSENLSQCICDESEGFLYFICDEIIEFSIIGSELTIDCNNQILEGNAYPQLNENILSVDILNCGITEKVYKLFGKLGTTNVNNLSVVTIKEQLYLDNDVFKNLPTLRKLKLKHLSHLQQLFSFSGMPSLEYLEWNVIIGSEVILSGDIFIELATLRNLTVIAEFDTLTSYPIHFKGLQHLQSFTFSNDGYNDVSLEHNNLSYLDLSDNKFLRFPEIITQNKETLKVLRLANNDIFSSYIRVFLRNFEILEELDLSWNSIIVLDELNWPSLKSLNLEGNTIESMSGDEFSLLNLTTLNINKNRIKSKERNIFKKLSFLEELEFNLMNRLISTELCDLRFLRKLTVISVLNNFQDLITNSDVGTEFDAFPESVFENCTELIELTVNFDDRLNYISSRIPEKAFKSLNNLERLDLSKLKLTSFPANALKSQGKLLEINLSNSKFESSLPGTVFKYTPNLIKISLKDAKLTNITENLFEFQSKVLEIDLTGNYLEYLPDNLFMNTTNLLKLVLVRNRMYEVSESTMSPLRNLAFLDLSYNQLLEFEGSLCQSLPSLRILNLRTNYLNDIDFKTCLEALQQSKKPALEIEKEFMQSPRIQFSFPTVTKLRNLEIDLQFNSFHNLNTLQPSELSKNFPPRSYRRPTELKLEDNLLECYCDMYELAYFMNNRQDFENLDFVKIDSHNFHCDEPFEKLLTQYSDKEFITSNVDIEDCPEVCYCSRLCLENIQLTDCSSRRLTQIPPVGPLIEGVEGMELNIENNNISNIYFEGNQDSILRILAANNSIGNISVVNFPKNLRVMDVRNNNFSKLDSEFLEKVKEQKVHLLLSRNDWLCDCNDLTFVQFFKRFPDLVDDKNSVYCWFEERSYPIDSKLLLCKFEFIPYVIGGLVLLLLAITIVALFLIYKMEIKVWLFAHSLLLCWVSEEDLDKDKKYDAFVCYSDNDEEYVVNIVEALETGPHPYKLCLHFRDWVIGEFIPKQIVSSVGQSRRIIFILTPNFMKSVWARLEFRTAHLASLQEKRPRVIVILCDSIESLGELDEELRAYINTNTYLKWGDRWFWDKLRYALPHKPVVREDQPHRVDIELEAARF